MAGLLQFLLLTFSGWVHREQQKAIDYLQAENRVLRANLGKRRIRSIDAERRELGRKGKAVGRRALQKLSSIVTPDTVCVGIGSL